MITEWFFQLSLAFNEFIAGLVPAPEGTPEFTGWAMLIYAVGGAGAWVNVPAMFALAVMAVSWWTAALLLKFIRALASHVPFIGGRG